MVDVTAVIAIIGFIGVIGTVGGLTFWLDRKIAAELREIRADMRDMRTDIRRLDRDIRVVSAKVDRAQGNLDVLVFGERGVPQSVEVERAELENLAEEAVGD